MSLVTMHLLQDYSLDTYKYAVSIVYWTQEYVQHQSGLLGDVQSF